MSLFGEDFLLDHVRNMVTDPRIAVMELIANCSDAGALNVYIDWPKDDGGIIRIQDDGVGLTHDEFMERWNTLSYQRRKKIGNQVIFPEIVPDPKPNRKLFGKSGKGRHSAFCFSDSYEVKTWKNEKLNSFKVSKSKTNTKPFEIEILQKDSPGEGQGTIIEILANRGLIQEEEIKEIVGSKFLLDPSFNVYFNREKIVFDDLSSFASEIIQISVNQSIEILFVDASQLERSSRLRGLVWWVNNRMINVPSWSSIVTKRDHLDGRSKAAKKYAFIIKADALDEFVDADWQSFIPNEKTLLAGRLVDDFIQKKLDYLLNFTRQELRENVFKANRKTIKEVTVVSQVRLYEFVEQVQRNCPTIREEDLIHVSNIFLNLEKSKNGFDLLKQLSSCSSDDLDRWHLIISKWDSRCAQIVLDEIDNRISLVNEMEKLVHERTTDELHELHPLFEKGLWIFGPQYESVEFVSNKTLKNIVENFLNGDSTKLAEAKRRPDLLTQKVGTWEHSRYDEEGNVTGAEKVLIVELKKGGFTIKQKELDQARDYALELKKSQAISHYTHVECFVLGSKIDVFASVMSLDEQNIKIAPKTYENVLRQANSRLFNLRKKIENISQVQTPKEIGDVLAQEEFEA